MANLFVRSSDGNNADNGSTWALAKATLAGALAVAAAGDTVYVSKNHAESSASSQSLASAGTVSSPVRILCVDDTGDPASPTTLATTGTCTTTGNTAFTFTGCAYCYGLTFSAGNSGSSSHNDFGNNSSWWWRLENCTLKTASTGGSVIVQCGNNSTSSKDQLLELINCTIDTSVATKSIIGWGRMVWRGGTYTAGTAALNGVFSAQGGIPFHVRVEAVDFSSLTGTPSALCTSASIWDVIEFYDCKLPASISLCNSSQLPTGPGGSLLTMVNCDSGATNNRFDHLRYQGEVKSETTIVCSGGFSDGTTAFSRKMISTANAKQYSPLQLNLLALWNDTTGSALTATVEVLTDNVTLKDTEAWLEVEYLGSSSYPIGSRSNDGADVLNSGTNQTTSSATWTTTGLGTPVKQKLEVTFTPQMKGFVRLRVHLGKASTTMYVGAASIA